MNGYLKNLNLVLSINFKKFLHFFYCTSGDYLGHGKIQIKNKRYGHVAWRTMKKTYDVYSCCICKEPMLIKPDLEVKSNSPFDLIGPIS